MWSDSGGEVESRINKKELITSFALYWFTRTAAGALRFYADSFPMPWQPSHGRTPVL